MSISSFDKDFVLNTKKEVESFENIISTPVKRIKIKKDLLSHENEIRAKQKLKQMLSR